MLINKYRTIFISGSRIRLIFVIQFSIHYIPLPQLLFPRTVFSANLKNKHIVIAACDSRSLPFVTLVDVVFTFWYFFIHPSL
jgi:hypothetical protein